MQTIYLSKLGYGEPVNGDTSQSVRALQQELGLSETGAYDRTTDAAVRAWQENLGNLSDPMGRSYLGIRQAAVMFPTTDYAIVNDGLPTIASAPELLAPWAVWNPIAGSPGLRAFTGEARKITLHTTETGVKPNWAAQGTGLPHFTFDSLNDRCWQHLPLDISAYTMIGGAYSPNSMAGLNIQIEIIGWAENMPVISLYWYANLKSLLDWLTTTLAIPQVFPFPFTDDAGSGVDGAVRQTWAAFSEASGIVGHSHAPWNSHWDPGLLDTEKLYPAVVEPVVQYATKADIEAVLTEMARIRNTLAGGFDSIANVLG